MIERRTTDFIRADHPTSGGVARRASAEAVRCVPRGALVRAFRALRGRTSSASSNAEDQLVNDFHPLRRMRDALGAGLFVVIALQGCARHERVATTRSDSVAAIPDSAAKAAGLHPPLGLRESSAAALPETAQTMPAPESMPALWKRIEAQDKSLEGAVAAKRLREAKDRANNLRDLVAVYTGRMKTSPTEGAMIDSLTDEMAQAVQALGKAADRKNATDARKHLARIKDVLARIAARVVAVLRSREPVLFTDRPA
jgi:hypothetical protein